jgi:hypothetical protein
MENEMNSENWSQPNENQQGTGPQPEKKPFFQQEWLQKTWPNVKLATWLKCFIVAFVLSAVAVFIAPEFTPAQYQRQDSQSSEYQEDVYGNYECEGGWYDENESEYGWSDDSECIEDSSDDSECIDYSFDDYYECEEDWSDDSECIDDSSDDYYECEEDWSDYDYYYED